MTTLQTMKKSTELPNPVHGTASGHVLNWLMPSKPETREIFLSGTTALPMPTMNQRNQRATTQGQVTPNSSIRTGARTSRATMRQPQDGGSANGRILQTLARRPATAATEAEQTQIFLSCVLPMSSLCWQKPICRREQRPRRQLML